MKVLEKNKILFLVLIISVLLTGTILYLKNTPVNHSPFNVDVTHDESPPENTQTVTVQAEQSQQQLYQLIRQRRLNTPAPPGSI